MELTKMSLGQGPARPVEQLAISLSTEAVHLSLTVKVGSHSKCR